MAKFRLSNGWETDITEHDGKYVRVHAQRIYTDPAHQADNNLMSDKLNALPDKRIEVTHDLYNFQSGGRREATDTYFLAVNDSYEELPTVEYYMSSANNTRIEQVIEIVLRAEEWTKRLLYPMKGNMTLGDMLSSGFVSELYEELCEEPDKFTGVRMNEEGNFLEIFMSTEDGDLLPIEIDSERDFGDMIVSIRVVKFDLKFLKWNPQIQEYGPEFEEESSADELVQTEDIVEEGVGE